MMLPWLMLLVLTPWCGGAAIDHYEDNSSVQLFREYLRINTAQPNVNYTEAVEFWKRQALSVDLPCAVYEVFPGKPIVVITWTGTDPTLPSIMLNSHMDVVTADPSEWTYPPFAADMDDAGNIYGRGAQDMKSVAIQYLEAIRRLRANNITLARTLHMTIVPDEEIGGHEGMKAFVETAEFAAMKVGFALDEGMANANNSYAVFYADRTPWQIVISCSGVGGHGSSLPEAKDTAAEKIRRLVNSFLDYRQTQLDIMKADPTRQLGSVTSINLTKMSGGIATNIIPTSMSCTFDMRLAFDINATAFNETISKFISDAGGDSCSYYYERYEDLSPATTLDDSNIYWVAFKKATDNMGLDIVTMTSPATSDMIRLRTLGIPAIGFFAVSETRQRIHMFDEFIHAGKLLRGIDIYYNLLPYLANA